MSTPAMDAPAIGSTAATADELVRREWERRERVWSPAVRWQVIQETIRWAEAQVNARRNTPAACLASERRKR